MRSDNDMRKNECLPGPRSYPGVPRAAWIIIVVLTIVSGYTLCLQQAGVTTAAVAAMLAAVVAATTKIAVLCTRQVGHG